MLEAFDDVYTNLDLGGIDHSWVEIGACQKPAWKTERKVLLESTLRSSQWGGTIQLKLRFVQKNVFKLHVYYMVSTLEWCSLFTHVGERDWYEV